jgi:hypothetical protein
VPPPTSETSVDIDFNAQQYIPEDFELHIRRRENLKSHNVKNICECLSVRELVSVYQGR